MSVFDHFVKLALKEVKEIPVLSKIIFAGYAQQFQEDSNIWKTEYFGMVTF